MKTNEKRPFQSGIPSWGLTALAFVATIILFTIIASAGHQMKINDTTVLALYFVINGLFVAACCFFIIRQNPKSIWYVPVICNLVGVGIFSLYWNSEIWKTYLWIIICGIWVLSIIASIIGYRIGKRSLPDDVNAAK